MATTRQETIKDLLTRQARGELTPEQVAEEAARAGIRRVGKPRVSKKAEPSASQVKVGKTPTAVEVSAEPPAPLEEGKTILGKLSTLTPGARSVLSDPEKRRRFLELQRQTKEGIRTAEGKLEAASTRSEVLNLRTTGLISVDQTVTKLRELRVDAEKKTGQPSPLRALQDAFVEASTFGKAETQTLNRGSLGEKFEKVKAAAGKAYDDEASQAREKGLEVTETRSDYLARTVGTKDEYVTAVIKAGPKLKSIAKEVGLASIPVYGTARTWEDSPWWARSLAVASDLLFLVPVAGQVSAGVRAGTSAPRIAAAVAIAEIKAPFTAIRHPVKTIKTAFEPLETALVPKKIPLAATEIRTSTVRLPAATLGVEEAKLARDIATAKVIAGKKPVVVTPTGSRVELTSTALRTVAPLAVHATPDIRPFLQGLTVQFGREGGLFVSPTLSTRFTLASAFGDLPEGAISGAILIRDQKVLSTLESSGKLFKGTAEIEAVLPAGVKLPKPSQLLHTRDVAGNRITLAVIGKPFTPTEIAKLKFIGAVDTVRDMFRPATRISKGEREVAEGFDDFIKQSAKAEGLHADAVRASRAGAPGEASRLTSEATRAELEARNILKDTLGRQRTANPQGVIRPTAAYFGRQDIAGALDTLGGKPTPKPGSRDLEGKPARAVPEATPARPRSALQEPRPRAGALPPRRASPELAPTAVPPPPRRVEEEEKRGRGRFPRFSLPGGKKLPEGEFPKVVTWPQGQFQVRIDLQTGAKVFLPRKSPGGVTPREGFRVVSTSKERPREQLFQQGAVAIKVTPSKLSFSGRRGVRLFRRRTGL